MLRRWRILHWRMIIIETPTFTRQITELLLDDLYRELQEALWVNPTLGALIPGSGGLRKVRWQLPGKGKRGGIRVIYYWYSPTVQIYMLLACGKSDQENPTPQQLKILKDAR
jgi:mRNA-degrading endonuclease RelE of RelBE toxin-antitoxin system